jgi:hypothetical protein
MADGERSTATGAPASSRRRLAAQSRKQPASDGKTADDPVAGSARTGEPVLSDSQTEVAKETLRERRLKPTGDPPLAVRKQIISGGIVPGYHEAAADRCRLSVACQSC